MERKNGWKRGDRVTMGNDGHEGTVLGKSDLPGYVRVKWDGQRHTIGAGRTLAHESALKAVVA